MLRPADAFALLIGCAAALTTAAADERRNYFDDPFVQVTHGLPGCPVPPGPEITEAEMRAEAHSRSERGGSCYRDGRCRLPNAYRYDREIIPRVQLAIESSGRFAGSTSVWVLGQRRWVWLKGCVSTAAESAELVRLARSVEDVEAVLNELQIKPPR